MAQPLRKAKAKKIAIQPATAKEIMETLKPSAVERAIAHAALAAVTNRGRKTSR